ncbi:hypothetical protein JRO89_XS10G0070600 [Xanthoceras sorbifolium]|uniref:DUF7806 domain-containing protein n=1 Tax=Xanthoceras sorbifolium TaxID=99658 RepID=A0ABQ8HI48_9ROSI|nr:hypothetical protein JRO89_XS10G0070600 [Xanthoceras sorbifolium]
MADEALSQEVERLQKVHQEAISSRSKDGRNDNMLLNTPEGAQTTSGKLSSVSAKGMTRKRRRDSEAEREGMVMASDSGRDGAIAVESAKDSSKETVSTGSAYDQRVCPSGGCRSFDLMAFAWHDAIGLLDVFIYLILFPVGANDDGPGNCLFQDLIEYLVDMKLSACHQTEGTGILALHQSSGYSFNLTWVKSEAGEELELLYRVSSLGTFERVAPDWMRDVIVFSVSMCPMFFDRIGRVIKLHD